MTIAHMTLWARLAKKNTDMFPRTIELMHLEMTCLLHSAKVFPYGGP
jgi:hypothetical protein